MPDDDVADDEVIPTPPTRWRAPAMYYIVGAGMVLMGGIGVVRGIPWFVNLFLAAAGVMVLIGLGRPLYRCAVRRVGEQEIVCRFIPWYRANTISGLVTFPIMGLTTIAWGSNVDSSWLQYGGYFILALGIASICLALLQSTNRLSVTPDSLRGRIGRRFDIPRERVVEIKPRGFTSAGAGQTTRHWDLVYVPAGGGGNRIKMMLDMQFSVEPDNLAAALQMWKDGDPSDPGLLDRVEMLLRG